MWVIDIGLGLTGTHSFFPKGKSCGSGHFEGGIRVLVVVGVRVRVGLGFRVRVGVGISI